MWKEFKEFAMKGNMIDLAVGVVIGGAFGKVITSFVNDIITPLISPLTGRVDFTNLFISLNGVRYSTQEEAKKAGAATFNYGAFVTSLIDFFIVAFAIFLFVHRLNRLRKTVSAPVPDTKKCPFCLSKIAKEASRCPHCTSHLEARTELPPHE